MKSHTLKTWPSVFAAVESGIKTFEYRRNDRDFAVGDELILEWFDPSPDHVAGNGRRLRRRVTYIAHGGQFGIPRGFCVMAIVNVADGAAAKTEAGDHE